MKMPARSLTVAVAVTAALGVWVPTASAHVTVVSTTPTQGSTVTSVPTEVKMVFSEAPTKPTVSVAGPDGKTYSTGSTQATDAVVGIGLSSAALPSGVYTVTWSLTAPDGDAQNGTWTYFYQPPIQPKPPIPAPPA
ncbi:copper resistance protein CopC [Mycobacteroides franklinii]|uniref:copper resistance protein CopC n=1 Tax=Mycobacteroides franklinii TaxID=948102 RepID=UPI0013E8E941